MLLLYFGRFRSSRRVTKKDAVRVFQRLPDSDPSALLARQDLVLLAENTVKLYHIKSGIEYTNSLGTKTDHITNLSVITFDWKEGWKDILARPIILLFAYLWWNLSCSFGFCVLIRG